MQETHITLDRLRVVARGVAPEVIQQAVETLAPALRTRLAAVLGTGSGSGPSGEREAPALEIGVTLPGGQPSVATVRDALAGQVAQAIARQVAAGTDTARRTPEP
jgi:hypothetical protein